MRTTLNLEDELLRAAKARAAAEGETLTRFLERALRFYLQAPQDGGKTPIRFEPLTKKGRRVPGVDFDDRDAVYERMEGRS